MGDPKLAPRERFTYRHYKTWPDAERWELIEGQAWNMSPAPNRPHQRLITKLGGAIDRFLDGKPCDLYYAPFDVLLPEGKETEDEVDTIVQPDIVVYCDRSKLTEAGARGAPDLVVEILSPSTAKKDQHEKFSLYERHAVREYWIVDPEGRWLCVYRLEQGPDGKPRFDRGELRERLRDYSPIGSRVLEGFGVDPERLFAEED